MKILVFDDNRNNQRSAKAQLGEHELTVVGTYDTAESLLLPRTDRAAQKVLLDRQFGSFNPYQSDDEEQKRLYFAAEKVAREQCTTYPDFDVVLVDLLVPASEKMLGDRGLRFAGQEMPLGIFIAILAATRGGAKFVGVLTDSDHHEHPASACFDAFNAEESCPTPFMVGDCKVLLSNARSWIGQFDPTDFATELGHKQYTDRTDTVRAKNWAKLLGYLIG